MRRAASGLTLLEIMVATAILGALFTAVYSLVSATVKMRDRIEDQATPYAVGPVVMDRVVEDLRAATVEPYKDGDAFHAEVETVNGEAATKLDFVAAVPSRARVKVGRERVKAGLNEVGYRMRESETARGLGALYRREDLGVDEEPLIGGSYYKLADRVKEFRIDWFAEDAGDPATDDAKGEEEWDAKKEKKLPFACRITLTIVGETAVDDDGRPFEDAPEYTFVTFHVFASRNDKADQQQQPPR
jgi:prepilin-type N-terminal cleavage/methylation domain-containing protein